MPTSTTRRVKSRPPRAVAPTVRGCRALLLGGATTGTACKPVAEPAVTKAEIAERLDGIAPGETRDMGGGNTMTMHRLQVDQRGADGWQRANSTLGDFSVELPVPFQDFRVEATSDDGPAVVSDTVGGKTSGLLAWSATCIGRTDGALGPNAPAPGTDERQALGEPVAAHTRRVTFDDAACVLTVEAQGNAPLPTRADIDRFLGSLRRE